ncbi:glucosamine-6-phosphate deaminase [Gracilibacillus timonensis]|uniref:glucosamine-6-phosphate deaminase n=1 Tax=Gracilibacillus timonensis TaxID=1816696 RepID=UPI000824A912|nr:glucosamine-6-phosphate deaminase [Gracilibacillus timonensis]
MNHLRTVPNHEQLSWLAASKIMECIKANPNAVICLAGGDTPLTTYAKLVKQVKEEKIDTSKLTFVSLDEWVGLDGEDIGSCRQMLNEYLYKPLHLNEQQIIFFNGKANNIYDEKERITNKMKEVNGIDFILLGVGLNGHIGFNEPNLIGEKEWVQVVPLDDLTKKVSRKYFQATIPVSQGITLGLKAILQAKELLVIASGKKKAQIVKQIIEGPITNNIPATKLRRHKNISWILDEEAAVELHQLS